VAQLYIGQRWPDTIYLYEFTKEFLKDSAYADPCLMEVKSVRSRSVARGLESLAVLLRVEFFRFVYPLVSLDSIGGGVELLRDLVDIL